MTAPAPPRIVTHADLDFLRLGAVSVVHRYMGDHPELPAMIDESLMVDTHAGGRITLRPLTLPDWVQLRWMVAVVTCPYCEQLHEHPMARSSGWGWYRSLCDPTRSYYLVTG